VSDLEKICDYIAFLHRGKIVLYREKDELSEEYCIAAVDDALLEKLPAEDVLHVQRSVYGAEAVVRRASLPEETLQKPISIEELFVMMSKEMDER
ncbi:MAG: ABC transporter ATP-binding protein, partial [Oscillospiraceae bacterium]|nr:ABC transporter ATP-binding protein [Oscillospiraceae bacterium]